MAVCRNGFSNNGDFDGKYSLCFPLLFYSGWNWTGLLFRLFDKVLYVSKFRYPQFVVVHEDWQREFLLLFFSGVDKNIESSPRGIQKTVYHGDYFYRPVFDDISAWYPMKYGSFMV